MLRRDLLFLVKSASTLSSGPRGQTERSNPRVKKRAKRAAEVPFTLELGNNIQVTVDTVTKPFSMNKSNNGTRTNVEASTSASAGGLLKNDDNPDTSIVVNESSLLADSGDSLSESSVGEVFDTLKHTALPLLASTVQAMQLERVPDADSAHSTAAVFSPDKMRALVYDEARLASLTSAVECVTSSLSSIHTLKKTTGRRYEPAFPALLTASLWRQVGPLLQQIDHTMQAGRGKGTGSTDALTNANLRNIQVRYAAAFKQLRRALALRTRDVTDVLTPNQVVESIAYMQLCGALSDDVLGPMVADLKRRQEQQDPLRRPPSHHSLLSHLVSTVPAGEHILQKGGATVLLRVLGRQSVPGHFHLHQFIHTTLLPAVRDELAAAESLSEVALVDLTRCFVRYEVTGDYVEHLSRLWRPYLSSLRTTDCGNLLRLLTAPPAWAAEDPQRARPKGSRALRRLRKGGAAVNAAAEDYLPLIQEVCEVIVERGRQILQAGPTTATVGELQGWLELYPTLLQVNSPSWAEVYLTSADSIYYLLGEACKAHAADGAEKWWQTVLPVEQAERAIRSLIHRSTLIPEHPLHALLLKRLLYDPASKKSPPTANLALLSMELMTVDKRDDLMGYANHHGEEEQKEEKSVLSTEDSYYHTMRSYFSPTITADDAQQALALLRTHKAKLGATSFIAAMCVAPLWELPVPMQQGVLNHFTSIASGVTPEWLIKGVAAATHLQMMHDTNRHAHSPVVVADAVSVKRWLSRFTLGDVTRQVGIDGCTTLLEIFQLKDSYSVDNALAKSNVVHRVGFLLSRDEVEGAMPLESVPRLVNALQGADVFYTHLFSRLCRLLLAEVQSAPLRVFLPAFQVVAEEYSRRLVRGSVFQDVWEQLRQRLVGGTEEQQTGETLTLEEVVLAANAFAALDLTDQPLFLVLVHRLWQLVEEPPSSPPAKEPSVPYDYEIAGGQSREDDEGESRRRHVRQRAVQQLTPSAVAVMTTALLRWSHPKATPALLPHCLFSLRQQCHTLYPIDVVCVLPSLLRALHESELQLQHNNNSNNQNENENHVVEEGWLTTLPPTELEYLLVLLHRAYDGCRTFFLFLYKDVRTTPVEENQVALALPTALTHIEDIEQYSEAYRARFTHKIRTSILVVPKVYFVTVLVELCHSGMHDTPLATVCADRLLHEKERTVLRGRLSAEELTELFLSVCFHFLKSAGETSKDTATNDDVDGRHYLLPVLDALWERVEELEVKHIHAIRRCLFYYFEREKIDEDFLERLENQIQTIQHMDRQIKEKKRNMERAVADRIKEEKKESVSPLEQKATAPPAESVSMTADDLFDL